MQRTGILATGNDGRVGEIAAAPDKFVGKLGFDLVLHHSRLHEPAHPEKAGFGDRAGLPDKGDFGI
jgi:hypothetical protein